MPPAAEQEAAGLSNVGDSEACTVAPAKKGAAGGAGARHQQNCLMPGAARPHKVGGMVMITPCWKRGASALPIPLGKLPAPSEL